MIYGLEDVTAEEWAIAKKYFANHPSEIKARRYRASDEGVPNLSHSFIRIEGEIYAVARKEKLGQGAYAHVKKVMAENGQYYALKVELVDPAKKMSYKWRSHVHQDLSVLNKLGLFKGNAARKNTGKHGVTEKHYILQALQPGIKLSTFTRLYFEHPFIRRGRYPFHIEQDTDYFKITLAIAIANALKLIHDQGIVHCDIKPDNILIEYDVSGLTAHFVDLDRSLQLELGQDYYQGTMDITHPTAKFVPCDPAYAAPEALRNNIISKAHDVYALGNTFLKIPGLKYALKKANVLESMLACDREARPNIETILLALEQIRDNFFNDVSQDLLRDIIHNKDIERFEGMFEVGFNYKINALSDALDRMEVNGGDREMILNWATRALQKIESQRELLSFLRQLYLFAQKANDQFSNHLFHYINDKDINFQLKSKLDLYTDIANFWQDTFGEHQIFLSLLIIRGIEPEFVLIYLKHYHKIKGPQSIAKDEAATLLLLAKQYNQPLIAEYLQSKLSEYENPGAESEKESACSSVCS